MSTSMPATPGPDPAAVLDRRRGALLGLAVGDALGAAVEFKSRDTFPPVTGYRAGGPWDIPAGAWTDDTSMALALAHSLGKGAFDLDDQMREYARWRYDGAFSSVPERGCFDVGGSTAAAIARWRVGGTPAKKCGGRDEFSSGNGGIMRLAPAVLWSTARYPTSAAGGVSHAATAAHKQSLPTHATRVCLWCAEWLGAVLAGLVYATDPDPYARLRAAEESASARFGYEQAPTDFLRLMNHGYRTADEISVKGGGYVVDSLEAAMWAAWRFRPGRANSFKLAVLDAVNLGDDADTTGAVCGQIAGALYGESGIPPEWLAGLARKDLIERALAGLGAGRPGKTPAN